MSHIFTVKGASPAPLNIKAGRTRRSRPIWFVLGLIIGVITGAILVLVITAATASQQPQALYKELGMSKAQFQANQREMQSAGIFGLTAYPVRIVAPGVSVPSDKNMMYFMPTSTGPDRLVFITKTGVQKALYLPRQKVLYVTSYSSEPTIQFSWNTLTTEQFNAQIRQGVRPTALPSQQSLPGPSSGSSTSYICSAKGDCSLSEFVAHNLNTVTVTLNPRY